MLIKQNVVKNITFPKKVTDPEALLRHQAVVIMPENDSPVIIDGIVDVPRLMIFSKNIVFTRNARVTASMYVECENHMVLGGETNMLLSFVKADSADVGNVKSMLFPELQAKYDFDEAGTANKKLRFSAFAA